MVEAGKQVSIEYQLNLEDGTTVDTNVGSEPLVFEAGARQILPALETALSGMKVDESKNVTLSAEDGYGPVNPDAYTTVALEEIPDGARRAGAVLVAQDDSGNQRPVRVHEVREDTIVLDFNHPLAGQTLNFEVRILKIE